MKALVVQNPKIGLRDENIENMENALEWFGGEGWRRFCKPFVMKHSFNPCVRGLPAGFPRQKGG